VNWEVYRGLLLGALAKKGVQAKKLLFCSKQEGLLFIGLGWAMIASISLRLYMSLKTRPTAATEALQG
jgi:hypothetical protein